MIHQAFSAISRRRLSKLLRGSLAVVFTGLLVVLPSACGRDPLPTSANSKDVMPVPAKSLDAFTNAGSPEQTVAMEILSRTRYLKADHYEPVKSESEPDQGIFVLRRLTPDAPALSTNMIVMGPSVGPPRLIDRVNHVGETVRIETRPAPWHLVTGAGPLRVRIPMGRQAGSAGPVSWGEWELTDAHEGIYLKDAPTDPQTEDVGDIFSWLGLGFLDAPLCVGGGGSFCAGLSPEIINGECDLDGYADLWIDWKDWDDFCEFTGPWPWDWECDFNPLNEIRLTVGYQATAVLLLQLEGTAYGELRAELLSVPLGRKIKVGGLEGQLALKLDLFGQAGIENVKMQTGFRLETGIDVDVGWSDSENFYDRSDPDLTYFRFQPVFEPLSAGQGFVKLGLEPKVAFELEVLEDLAAVEASVGLAGYLRFAVDLDEQPTGCPNWHCENTANLDLNLNLKLAIEDLPDPSKTWAFPLMDPVTLTEHWGTGDLMVRTRTTGQDVDPNGYRIMVSRGDPTADPAWSEEYDVNMPAQDEHLWMGGSCRYLNPSLFDPSGILGCNLVAAQHRVQIDGVMWNCALQGEADRLRCLEAGEQVTETFNVDCVSAYAFLMDEVNDALLAGAIRNEGIAQSIMAKLGNAEKKRDHGDYQAAMNLLRALDHFLEISAGHQVEAAFAEHLSGRVHDVMQLFVWPQQTSRSRHAGR